jgi:hypothetical protein
MNKRAGIGATVNLIFVVLVAIGILAIISPVTNVLFEQGANDANLTSLERVVVTHFNLILLMFLTLILFILIFVLRGGG